ncbi:complement C3-like [Clavelina lepadiformis]|uniref:complement C3-like n=1 Tax=Clavelina lepadiformis TaxID=159417 RepID=UPI004042311C
MMLASTFLSFVTILASTGSVNGLDVVFSLPGKLIYSKNHSVILTVFHADVEEEIAVLIVLRNHPNNRQIYRHQVAFYAPDPATTRRFPIISNPSLAECLTGDVIDSDVICRNVIDVSVTTSGGLSWSQSKEVPVVRMKGHIFIQTDRPVYKPKDKVYVRFIPVDDTMRPLTSPMAMTILAPNPTLGGDPLQSWRKTKSASNAVFVRTFMLPDTPPIGKWTVKARFIGDDVVNDEFVTSFYVHEYKLPTFELSIRPMGEGFILPDDENFSCVLLANFVYGERVEGTASVRFGLVQPGVEEETLTTYVIRQNNTRDGRLEVTVPVSSLAHSIPISRLNDAGTHLFIEASVTDFSSGKTRSVRNSDVIFTSSPIVLSLERTSSYYKPGLPFPLQLSASYVNGSKASDISVIVMATAERDNGMSVEVFNDVIQTSAEGTLFALFGAPSDGSMVTVAARARYSAPSGSFYDTYVDKQVRPQESVHEEYLQVVAPASELVVGIASSDVEIYVTPSSRTRTVVYTITSGRSFFTEGKAEVAANIDHVTAPFIVSPEMSPTSHLTAYYVTETSSGLPFIVADSSVLRTEDSCSGIEPDTILLPGDQVPLPGDELMVDVRGDPSSYVGLTAVDVAALSLRREFPTDFPASTRSGVFELMRSFMPGCKTPATPTPESAFPAVGRALVTSVSYNSLDGAREQCDDSLTLDSRQRRSLHEPSIGLIQKADRFNGVAYECCAVGSSDVSSLMTYEGDTCAERAKTVTLSKECKDAFLECCLESECIRRNPDIKRRPCRIIADTKSISVSAGSTDISGFSVVERSVELLRANFDQTWFAVDFQLGQSGHVTLNNTTRSRIPPLPDSITSWSVGTFTISPDRGLCIAEPQTFAVEHSLFMEVDLPHGPVLRGSRLSVGVTIFNYLQTAVDVKVVLEPEDGLCISSGSGSDANSEIREHVPESREGIASTVYLRFSIIPLQSGDYRIKVKMFGDVIRQKRSRIDSVVKKMKVVSEGQPQRQVQWKLIEMRPSGRTRNRLNVGPRSSETMNLSLPEDAIPGSEKASINLHSLSSAFLRDPVAVEDDSATIAPYLCKLEATVTKVEYADGRLSDARITQLTDDAQGAYDGLLTYVRDVTPKSAGPSSSSQNLPRSIGFSYSPASVAKPDLWLTSAALRILCRAAILIEPDQSVLSGVMRWIESHQDQRRGFFASSPTSPPPSRRRRSSCPSVTNCNDPKKKFSFAEEFKKWQKMCRKRRRACSRRRRRNADRSLQKLPQFNNNLERKVYRTSVVASALHAVLSIADKWKSSRLQPIVTSDTTSAPAENRLSSINTSRLRVSLRATLRYLRRQSRSNTVASPMSLSAAGKSLFSLSARAPSMLEESILRHRREDGNTWWIDTNQSEDDLTDVQSLQLRSANVEATSYMLYHSVGRGLAADQYANWLLKMRGADNRWVSLRDTLAAQEALGRYVLHRAGGSPRYENLRIEVSTLSSATPEVIDLQDPMATGDIPADAVDLPVTNDAVSITASGSGKGFVELGVGYNLPTSVHARSTAIAPPVSEQRLCPYDVTVSIGLAPIKSPYTQLLRSTISDRGLKVALSIRNKANVTLPESDDVSYVVEFGLNSNYEVISEDLERLSNPIEKAVEHYRISQRALILYMSGERSISFEMTDKRKSRQSNPVVVYPAAFPEQKCTSFYSPFGGAHDIIALCSSMTSSSLSPDDACLCSQSSSCPAFVTRSESYRTSTPDRVALSCRSSVKFAYRTRMIGTTQIDRSWHVYNASILWVYNKADELESVERGQVHAFWLRNTCDSRKLQVNKDYLIFGESAVESSSGMFKHLLDATSRVEGMPVHLDNCERIENSKSRSICERLYDYNYVMRNNRGCPTAS